MQISINNTNTKKATKLISKFLELNANSDYDYLNNDNIVVGYNNNSGYSYIYLENNPSVSLCLSDFSDKIEIVYSSGLDGIEFNRNLSNKINSLDKLENILNIAYNLEDTIRNDDYNDDTKRDAFIKAMIKKGWLEL